MQSIFIVQYLAPAMNIKFENSVLEKKIKKIASGELLKFEVIKYKS